MAVETISRPDAEPLDPLNIHPARELESCNHLLNDHAALMRFHDEQGYIFLRDVISHEALDRCREEMFAIMVRHGLIDEGTTEPVWTGKPFPGGMEESPEFSGISRRLIEHPDNLKVMEQILGEPASMIPIVQYRTYPPGGSITPPHQDGFYSPGIKNYKPVWMPITACQREVGGLAVAVGQCNSGFFHLKEAPFSIPASAIPEEAWATTDYYPGDVLVLNPFTPHASLPNTSNRCRVTIDTRVESAAHPRVLLAEVLEARTNLVKVRSMDGQERSFQVDEKTFIRVDHPGVRQTVEDFAARTEIGRRVVVIFDGDHAETLRRASEG